MKAITFKVVRNGKDYLNTVWVPSNHSEEIHPSSWGFVIAGGLLVATATFVSLLLLAA